MNLWKKSLPVMVIASVCLSLTGCFVVGMAFDRYHPPKLNFYEFDVPPQTIYQIDDHRFFTLENYQDCEHGGIVYYNDTKKNIKKYLVGGSSNGDIYTSNKIINWKGGVIYAASDDVIAYPWLYTTRNDRDPIGNETLVAHSNNKDGDYISTSTGGSPGWGKTIVITDDAVFIKDDNPLPHTGITKYDIPYKNGSSNYYDVVIPSKAKTPTGFTKFTCNNAIKPTGKRTTRTQTYAAGAIGIPTHD